MRPGETIAAPNLGMRVTCRESAASSGGALLSFDFWMRGGATPPPMHVHPHQEERITVVSPPGESHTVGPAGNEDVEMVAELRPALTDEQFIERSFALDRAGHVNAKGRGNPLRMATAKPYEAEFFLPRIPIWLQRVLLRGSADGSPRRAADEVQQRSRGRSFDHLDRVGQLVERPSGRS